MADLSHPKLTVSEGSRGRRDCVRPHLLQAGLQLAAPVSLPLHPRDLRLFSYHASNARLPHSAGPGQTQL